MLIQYRWLVCSWSVKRESEFVCLRLLQGKEQKAQQGEKDNVIS